MIANIWKDDEVVFWSIEISLSDSPDLSSTRQWEGSFCIIGADKFDVRGRYRLGLDDGKSADIVLTHVLRREPAVVHFRVLTWKDKPQAFN
ncbi:MAG TPA: hypothetical protein VGV87_22825 [Blastocatellia bacterium]|jgi:hypothetical protein|nr:hypothetical protein [Blastocatellia bacterium]